MPTNAAEVISTTIQELEADGMMSHTDIMIALGAYCGILQSLRAGNATREELIRAIEACGADAFFKFTLAVGKLVFLGFAGTIDEANDLFLHNIPAVLGPR